PGKGIGYGLLRYLRDGGGVLPFDMPAGRITFNYLGDFGSGVSGATGEELFLYSGDYRGRELRADYELDHALTVTGLQVSGRLRVMVDYSRSQYDDATIAGFVNRYESLLLGLIRDLAGDDGRYVTPSDLSYRGLSMSEVSALGSAGEVEDVYELSPLQEGIYYHWLAAPGTTAYVEQSSYRLKGRVDIGLLEQSYARLLSRHAILRTAFTHQYGGRNLQVVSRQVSPVFIYRDISGHADKDGYINTYKQNDRAAGFDLGKGSQMRLSVLDLGNQEYEFVWSHHHILMDGWCGTILINECYRIYYALLNKREPLLDNIPSYAHYIRWLSKLDRQVSRRYWQQYLENYETQAPLPFKQPFPAERYDGKNILLQLDAPALNAMQALCRQLEVTESTFIQCAWGYLLSYYNNTQDVVFGSVVSGRPGELDGVEHMIGLFINTVPVRIRYEDNSTVRELLRQAQQEAIASLPHHYTQLSEIQADSPLRNGLFDHLFIYENYPVQPVFTAGATDEGGPGLEQMELLSAAVAEQTNYDFNITVVPAPDGMQIILGYNAACYDPASVARISGHLSNVIGVFTAAPDTYLSAISCLAPGEQQQLLYEWNDTEVPYPGNCTIVDMFEAQALKTPHNTAVVFGSQSVTYSELNGKANTLAFTLSGYGIGPSCFVPLLMSRGIDYVVAFLAVLKTGAAAVPLSINWPAARLQLLLGLLDAQAVLVNKVALERAGLNGEIPALQVDHTILAPEGPPFVNRSCPEDPIYMFYTSGTTGTPKGVVVPHQGITNRFLWMNGHFGTASATAVLRTTRHIFDSSVWQLYWPLINGGKTVIPEEDIPFNLQYFTRLLQDHAISMTDFVPSLFNELVNELQQGEGRHDLHSLQHIVIGGEAITVSAVNRFRECYPGIRLTNLYGPTEASIGCVYFELEAHHYVAIPIGRPISNVRIYILDKKGRPVPEGVNGEICIAGVCLAQGYFKDAAGTASRFLPDRYAPATAARPVYYRTGDTGKWLPDGNIAYTGRADDQVKIRGYRIEPAEIEDTLRGLDGVKDAVVVARTTGAGARELVACITGPSRVDMTAVHTYLKSRLPEYMIPRVCIQVDELPLTAAGKVDRKLLLEAAVGAAVPARSYVPPGNELEHKLVKMWQEVLELEQPVGIHDNFFELGGHSIKAIVILSRVQRELGIALGVKELFEDPTVVNLAKKILNIEWLQKGLLHKAPGQEYEKIEL
ncbi:non-ribosomal peptide synthetase, partial [Chitinophaga japonensis]